VQSFETLFRQHCAALPLDGTKSSNNDVSRRCSRTNGGVRRRGFVTRQPSSVLIWLPSVAARTYDIIFVAGPCSVLSLLPSPLLPPITPALCLSRQNCVTGWAEVLHHCIVYQRASAGSRDQWVVRGGPGNRRSTALAYRAFDDFVVLACIAVVIIFSVDSEYYCRVIR